MTRTKRECNRWQDRWQQDDVRHLHWLRAQLPDEVLDAIAITTEARA